MNQKELNQFHYTDDHFNALYKFGKTLNSLVYEDSLIEEALDSVVEALDAERGLFARFNAENEEFQIIAARNVEKETINSIDEFSSGILNEILETRKPILYHDAQTAKALSNFESVRISGIKSVIGVPVYRGEELWGIIIADSLVHREKFNRLNLSLLELFSNMLSLALDRIVRFEKLQNEKIELQNKLENIPEIPDMIGSGKKMQELMKLIKKVAATDATVLITGESGTGKDLAAQAIHNLSPRKNNVFLAQFCGSIPDNLLESELFGYKKGAFTGATSDKKGLLEAADGGTFFLDEIADISLSLQAKLLRVIENREIIRLGDTKVKKIDVRIITATNKNLKQLVSERKFREDLFYRLNVFPIKVPALRERREDIPELAHFYLTKLGGKNISLTSSALKKLQTYQWRGNIRQLINVIQRGIITSSGNKLTADNIIFDDELEASENFSGTLAEIEKKVLLDRLKELDGNKTLAAESLGVSRKWIYLKLDEINKGK